MTEQRTTARLTDALAEAEGDITERLRSIPPGWVDTKLGKEAAGVIDRLRAEIAFLRADREQAEQNRAEAVRLFWADNTMGAGPEGDAG